MTPLSDNDLALQKTIMQQLIRVLKPAGLLVVTVDFNFPRDNCLLESNVNVANLLAVDNAELYGDRCRLQFPGEEGFDPDALIREADIDIVNYWDTLQTSIGLTLKKRDRLLENDT